MQRHPRLSAITPITVGIYIMSISLAGLPGTVAAEAAALEDGFVPLFNGGDLTGWTGDPKIWSVLDGAIVGKTTASSPIRENSYLVWEGEIEDFELRLRYRIENGNSGVYCRAARRTADQKTPDPVIAWQADIDAKGEWTGVIMEWTRREKLADRGERVRIEENGQKTVVGKTGDRDALWAKVHKDDWNYYRIVARGGHITLEINGAPMAEIDDCDPRRAVKGLLALQVHVGDPMRVTFKDIRLRKIEPRSLAAGPVRDAVSFAARPFDLRRVRLLEGPARKALERNRKYLLDLDPDRLLHTFRLNAGLPSSAQPYGGWERPDCEVRGHSMGHYLSACALMYASTSDEKLKARASAIVAELAKCQKALGSRASAGTLSGERSGGGPCGYLSAFPESFFDRVEEVKPVWAPYYTIHKILAGLLDVHTYCGNDEALDVARGMVRWAKGRNDRLDEAAMQRMLEGTEQGGMNDALANVHAVTGDPESLALSLRFNERFYNDPLARREDRLRGLHVNSFVPNVIGTARQFELTGREEFRTIVTFFWDAVVGGRTYATGGTSNEEHWRTDPHVLANELGPNTQETCCTYNMLKLTRHLFSWTGDPKYADYYERAFFTSILGTQDPETGMTMYFVPLASGYWKVFGTPFNSFWCCTGTGMESFSKLADSIYFEGPGTDCGRSGAGGALYVNLFVASEVDWPEKGLKIRQETAFPEEEGTSLVVRAQWPIELEVKIRIPWWARQGMAVKVNGERATATSAAVESPRPSSYLTVHRTWKDGDRVEIVTPLSLYSEAMPDDKTLVAFLYGPLILAGELGSEGLTREIVYRENQGCLGPPIEAPCLILESEQGLRDLGRWIRPVEGKKLTFRTVGVGQPRDVTLVPYHRLFGQRYAVYWRVCVRGSPEHREMLLEEERRKARLARIVDEVVIGNEASEAAHGLKQENSRSGPFRDRAWRDAANGWFSYDMKVPADGEAALACEYWGDDSGNRVFDILVDGTRVATQKLDRNKPGELFEVEYAIPTEVARGKGKVTVRLQAHPGCIAGGVFAFAILKRNG